ncbi:MAG: PAS domain S-box protein [Archangiaceae bacterium]|nr:PAS domain S-box protein [Archangiaceae bacterium]
MTEADFPIFETIGALVVVLDADDRVVYWNRACSALTGYSLEEVRDRRFWDFLLVPDEIDALKADLAELRASEQPRQHTNNWVTKSGEHRSIAWSNSLALAPDGRPQYVIKTGIDRTESRRVDDERQLLAELGRGLLATIDCDTILTRVAGLVVQRLADCCAIALPDLDGQLRWLKVATRDPALEPLCARLHRLAFEAQHPPLISEVLESRQPLLLPEVSAGQLEAMADGEQHLLALRALAPRSVMIVPLLARGSPPGTLALMSTQPSRSYDRDELRFAEELAVRVTLAIENARLYARLRSDSFDLREANERMVCATLRAQERLDDRDPLELPRAAKVA